MTSTLALAMEKVALLPEETQERIGLELIDHVAALEALRAAVDVGVRELDAGLGRPLDIQELIRELKEGNALE